MTNNPGTRPGPYEIIAANSAGAVRCQHAAEHEARMAAFRRHPFRRVRGCLIGLAGYEVYYEEAGGGHNAVEWRSTFADGLVALCGTSAPETARR